MGLDSNITVQCHVIVLKIDNARHADPEYLPIDITVDVKILISSVSYESVCYELYLSQITVGNSISNAR